jgi:hypothetical protein
VSVVNNKELVVKPKLMTDYNTPRSNSKSNHVSKMNSTNNILTRNLMQGIQNMMDDKKTVVVNTHNLS